MLTSLSRGGSQRGTQHEDLVREVGIMRNAMKGWMVLGILLATMAYAIAENVTMSTYYPSPRGVYQQLQTSGDTSLATQSGNVGIGTSPVAGYKLYVTGNGGNVYATGNMRVGGTYTCSSGPDLAEHIAFSKNLPRAIEAGDVVVIDPHQDETITLTSRPYDPTVAGIISAKPGVLLAADLPGKAIALVGRVPTKVTTENGAIHRGDFLVTASKLGYAMRGDPATLQPGMVIGKALGELTEGDGTVIALVNLQ